jgi:hypothetical protein
MKNLKTFSEFVSEAAEFNPANTSDIDVLLPAIKSASELMPGKEYVVKLNGKNHANMMYQGVSDGNYIFNSEDMETVLNLNREQINGAVSDGGVQQVNEAVRRTADQVNKDSEDRIKNQIARYSELMKTKPEKANYYKAQLDLAHARATMINLKKKVDALKESTGLNEAKTYKGKEVLPDWIDPKRDFGAPIKNAKELKVGAEYIIYEPGMDNWQAENIYQGYTGGIHIFNSSTQFGEAEPLELTDKDLASAIKDGEIIKQN